MTTGRDLACSVDAVGNLADLTRFMNMLHELWVRDPEQGHSIDDEIRERVLKMCAAGHPQAHLLAGAVLVTSTWNDVSRYTA